MPLCIGLGESSKYQVLSTRYQVGIIVEEARYEKRESRGDSTKYKVQSWDYSSKKGICLFITE